MECLRRGVPTPYPKHVGNFICFLSFPYACENAYNIPVQCRTYQTNITHIFIVKITKILHYECVHRTVLFYLLVMKVIH